MSGNLYVILGVSERARESEIKKAYRRLARKYHPDINPGDRSAEERFKGISEAYEILRDPEKRGFYDENGYFIEGALEDRGPLRWDVSFSTSESSAGDVAGFGEVFDGFLSQTRSQPEPDTNNDIETQLSLTFVQSVRGLKSLLEIHRKRLCEACNGSGLSTGFGEADCRDCSGTGQFVKAKGHLRFSMTCLRCSGTGQVRSVCSVCTGQGRVIGAERVGVKIPAGVISGSRVRIPGKGHLDARTRRCGDLYVVTNIGAHPFFQRAGDNIHCAVPVTVTEAALGAKVEIPTLDGPAVLKVPPGVQTGHRLRLRGKGAPSLRGKGIRGDQYVELKVLVPRVGDERSKELLRELERLNPENPRKDIENYGG